MFNPLMVRNAEQYRANAMKQRERGGNGVQVYASTAALEAARGRIEASPLEQLIASHRDRVADLMAQFDWDARLSHVMGGTNDCPF